jgi:peptidylprolyl isomerase
MAPAKSGDTVKVNYTGKTDDGAVFDTSNQRGPLEFKIGEGRVIPDFEKAIIGMEPGESKTVRIPAENAYGPRRDDMVMVVDKKDVPKEIYPQVNERLQIKQSDGKTYAVTVTEVTENKITLDANHPLAGRDLTVDIPAGT